NTGYELATRLRQVSIERMAQWFVAMAPSDLAALHQGLEALATVAKASITEPHTSTQTGASNGSIDHAE
ncbi:MAG TPA: hypothetical protein VKB76_16580, partial [Ktedonobacterales bacterium]|nr:hypothetical protein [Ktedonobacterales bacterium]